MADIFCGNVQGDFVPLECSSEKGRIIAIGLVLPSDPLTDPSDTLEWTTRLGASPQTAFVINSGVRGEMPRASDTEEDGFGLDETQLTGASHAATAQILGLKNNTAWTNFINKKQWHVAMAYSEGDMLYVDVPVTVVFRPVIQSALKSANHWDVSFKWSDINNPTIYTTPAALAVT